MAGKKDPKKPEETTALTTAATTALGSVQDYGDDAERGYQNQTQADIKLPRLGLLQKMSYEVDKAHESYIEGAEPGGFFNKATRELLPNEVFFVACLTRHEFIQWIPRDAGGGYVKSFPINHPAVLKAKEDYPFNALKIAAQREGGGMDDLVETFTILGAHVDPATLTPIQPMALDFKSTSIEPYQNIIGRIRAFRHELDDGRKVKIPLFGVLLKVVAVPQSKAKGNFHNYKITAAVDDNIKASTIPMDHPLYAYCGEMEKLADAGHATVDREQSDSTDGASKEDLPF